MTTHGSLPSEADDDIRLLILYATETGNAQDVADRVARSCRNFSFKRQVMSVDRYSLENLVTENLVIFIVSTTGSGVEPRSMTLLWHRLLSAHLPPDLFDGLSFAVFGLGDTSYEKFCWPAKLLSKRLKTLGANEICERGEGDDQHPLGFDGALEPWLESLQSTLTRMQVLSDATPVASTSKIPPPRVVLQPQKASRTTKSDSLMSGSHSIPATVIKNERMTAKDWFQDVRRIEFQLAEAIE